MLSRFRPFRSGGLWRPSQNPHSLDYLKYLYGVLNKNKTVTASNRETLIEALRAISEILIWGDQNDGSVFDFFLEKNMLEFFLHYMQQKSAQFVCVQLLQTLNILFENIRNETSLYYLLSNNHINSIIVHKFDFSDEEVLAYYISFLKTLSLKLNQHTIHFFYNEHTNDFPLYTEAIKFFNHSESMVRIAVRTLTLNVYRVPDASMLRFIRDHTAAPYFSNFVWFVGNHILEIDSAIRNDADHSSRDRLADLVAEHLDHLHYLNDILRLDIESLNDVLTDHLLDRLFLPLYIRSLWIHRRHGRRSRLSVRRKKSAGVTRELALYLLTQVFLIITHPPLVRQLADIIFNTDVREIETADRDGDDDDDDDDDDDEDNGDADPGEIRRGSNRFLQRPEPLDEALPKLLQASAESAKPLKRPNYRNSDLTPEGNAAGDADPRGAESAASESAEEMRNDDGKSHDVIAELATGGQTDSAGGAVAAPGTPTAVSSSSDPIKERLRSLHQELRNITDEEKVAAAATSSDTATPHSAFTPVGFTIAFAGHQFRSPYLRKIRDANGTDLALSSRPHLESIFKALECLDHDYDTLFALTLIYSIGHNVGINRQFVESTQLPTPDPGATDGYNSALAERLIFIISQSCKSGSKVRLVTLDLAIQLLKLMSTPPPDAASDAGVLDDRHSALIENARGEAVLYVRNFYKSEDLFLDMFEDEFRDMKARPVNVSFLCTDASILLPPIGTPLSGIEFAKRLPCGESERARRAIRVFLLLRDVTLHLNREIETALPLTKESDLVRVNDVLDLNNSDLIACTVIMKEGKLKRFLVIGADELILVEPDTKRLGWGMATFVGLLQDSEVEPDKEDTRSLYVTVHRRSLPSGKGSPLRGGLASGGNSPRPLLSARLVFDDHIRCMAARQRLSKGRHKARQRKMHQVARMLELSSGKLGIGGGQDSSHHRGRRVSSSSSSSHHRSSTSTVVPSSSFSSQRQQPQMERIRGLHAHSHRIVKEKGIAVASGVAMPGRVEAESGWDSTLRYFDHRGVDIEEAEDAALSLQNLDKESSDGKKRNESSGSNVSGFLESSEEIPLEDLSRLKGGARHLKSFVSPSSLAEAPLNSSHSKHRSRSATPPSSSTGRHRRLHRLSNAPPKTQSRSRERPGDLGVLDVVDGRLEEIRRSADSIADDRVSTNGDEEHPAIVQTAESGTASLQHSRDPEYTRVSEGRASASSSGASHTSIGSSAPKSLTPAPLGPASLVDDSVAVGLEEVTMTLVPPADVATPDEPAGCQEADDPPVVVIGQVEVETVAVVTSVVSDRKDLDGEPDIESEVGVVGQAASSDNDFEVSSPEEVARTTVSLSDDNVKSLTG